MKSLLSVIRWKFVLPMALVVAAILVFFILFFDPLVEQVIERVASRINGAKVEVEGFKTKFLKGRVAIEHVQVANKAEPMQNVVEAGPMTYQMDFSELFSKRVIINDASLLGLRFNTPRKTSGALPRLQAKQEKETPSAAAKLAAKYKDRFKLNLEGIKTDVKEKIEFDPKNLEITRQSEDLKETAEDLPVQWEKSVEELNVEERLKKVEADLEDVKNTPVKGPEALTAVPAGLKKLKQVQEDLTRIKSDVEEARNIALKQLNDVRAGVRNLPLAKKKDLDDLMSRFNLDFADPDRLVEGIVGPLVLTRFQTVFGYVEMARKHMPSQKVKASLPPRPRAGGMNVEFPTPAAPPRFWLMNAALEGAFQDIQAAGSMTHLTSDPTRVGKPFKLEMSGQKGVQRFSAQATFDHVGERSTDSVAVQVNGLDVAAMVAGGAAPGILAGGEGRADLAVSLLGEGNIGGQMALTLSKINIDEAALLKEAGLPAAAGAHDADPLSPEDALKLSFVKDVAAAIEKTPQVQVSAQLFGTWQDPGLKLSSNLGGILGQVIKNSIGNLVQDQRKQLDARLNQVLKEKTAEVEAKAAGLEKKLNAQLGAAQAKVQEKINEAAGINLISGDGSSSPKIKVPSLDKLFKK